MLGLLLCCVCVALLLGYVQSSGTGQFTIPTAPSVGTAVAQSASANTYGSYVQMIASTAAALFITGVRVSLAVTNLVQYVSVQIGTGGSGSEATVGQVDLPIPFTAGATGTNVSFWVPISPPIPVANATRIAVKTASNIASALNWNVCLTCINQANVVDAGVVEEANVVWWNGQVVPTTNVAGVPLIDIVYCKGGTVSAASSGVLDINVKNWANTTVPAPNVTGVPTVDVVDINGDSNAAVKLFKAYTGLSTGAVQSGGTASTIFFPNTFNGNDNYYNDMLVYIYAGTGIGQTRPIQSYIGSSKSATIYPNWTTQPDPATSSFILLPAGQVDVGNWINGTVPAVSVTGVPKVDVADWRGTTPNALVSGRVDVSIGANNAGNLTADLQTIKTQTVTCGGGVTIPAATLASTTNITAGTITTTTNLTNLPSIPNNWLTASGIAAGALNGKGDWLVSSSYPANFSALGITPAGKISEVVLCDTITTYTGDTPQTGDSFARIGATGSGLTSLASHADAVTIDGDVLTRASQASVTALGNPMQAGTVVTIDTTAAVPTTGNTANSIADCLNAARAQGFGKWVIDPMAKTLTLYAPDGATVVHQFTLDQIPGTLVRS